jgi:hypothetical protein
MPASGLLTGQRQTGSAINSPDLFPFPSCTSTASLWKLGGRLVSFNVDRDFSGVLDGLVLVDLRQTDASVLARYMGKTGVEAFRRYHGLVVPAGPA